MPLSGVPLIRQTFGEQLPKGWSVAQAQLDYVHPEEGGEFQVLTFHVIDPAGEPHVITSDMVLARDDVNELTIKTAKKFLGGLKDGPPDGIDPKDGGKRSVG